MTFQEYQGLFELAMDADLENGFLTTEEGRKALATRFDTEEETVEKIYQVLIYCYVNKLDFEKIAQAARELV